jgi:hypothetical protein
MTRLFALTVFLVAFSAHAAAAQHVPVPTGERAQPEARQVVEPRAIDATDAVAALASPELQAALEELGERMSAIAAQIASDPELRTAALRAAGGMVGMAEILVTQQAEVIQEALRTAAERIAELPVPEPAASEPR